MGVVLAGLTTMVGFGSLTISGHQGIHSLGVLTTVGSLSILGAAVLFLPALLQLFRDLRSRDPDSRSPHQGEGEGESSEMNVQVRSKQ